MRLERARASGRRRGWAIARLLQPDAGDAGGQARATGVQSYTAERGLGSIRKLCKESDLS